VLAVFALAAVAPLLVSPGGDVLNNMVLAAVYVVMALGLNIIVGFAGLLDLGYVAFFAIGAYTAAYFGSGFWADAGSDGRGIAVLVGDSVAGTPGIHVNFVLILALAVAATAVAGTLIGVPTLRLRGDSIAIVTLALRATAVPTRRSVVKCLRGRALRTDPAMLSPRSLAGRKLPTVLVPPILLRWFRNGHRFRGFEKVGHGPPSFLERPNRLTRRVDQLDRLAEVARSARKDRRIERESEGSSRLGAAMMSSTGFGKRPAAPASCGRRSVRRLISPPQSRSPSMVLPCHPSGCPVGCGTRRDTSRALRLPARSDLRSRGRARACRRRRSRAGSCCFRRRSPRAS
jgi:Branched-chain amino acid transport system / permease component